MSADHDLERRIADFYAAEAPPRAPDWVLGSALANIDTTPQRRALIRVPWRIQNMNSFAKVAVAAVVVIAVGAVGLAVLRPGPAPGVASPSPSLSPPASPSPSSSPDPSAPPPLSGTFLSTTHGISISYPNGWVTDRAMEPWTPTGEIHFQAPFVDTIFDPLLTDHLFLGTASQPLAGKAGETWATDFLTHPAVGCGSPPEPITVDGASGLLCDGFALVWAGDRGYLILLYTSGDEPWLSRVYDDAWFRGVLATVQLHPEDAADQTTSPSASASSS